MRIYLSGHLNWYEKKKRSRFELELAGETRLVDMLEMLGIPQGEVAITLVNGEMVSLQDAVVFGRDEVRLYPPSSGG
jgi:sulfur carrier protein ThiS